MVTTLENALSQLKASARDKKLVAVIGSGVSMALTNGKNPSLSWKGLIENGFKYGVIKGKITAAQKDTWGSQLNSSDIDDFLGAAEFVSRKLDAPDGDLYARWLESVFKDVKPESAGMTNAIRALRSAEIPLCTLNYDPLLESVTGLSSINFTETPKIASWMRREIDGILHLHGSWDAPASCILGIRDYETTISNDIRDLIQRTLSSFGRLLFVGCGDTFADPNFSALINWLREKLKAAAPQHYALVIAADEPLRHADPSWHGFVEPISYGVDRRDLPEFLLKQFPSVASHKEKSKAARKPPKMSPSAVHEKTIQEYCAFLNRECGQMTIEGVRADMDTAQRKFDLERLFVPLKVLPTPPEFPPSDPEREQKLLKWQEKNKEPIPFGDVFKKRRHIALLALPGGGKTLLLKRLAVAYANPVRQKYSEDNLPDLDVTPVLIRCREWKEYIQRPIPVLLKNIAAITGQASLTNLSEALFPLLDKGRILLLVDGLDEIHNDADRATFVENLEAFLNQYKHTHLVVTSREAGFSLVAPSIARFCERWRLAPLQDDAVKALCCHWHRLMIGDTPESITEAEDVAERLLRNSSLRRLSENPLLLTMLLVVKHGAGRLPPDRVSLYDRAIEVLLDTWNIKGHEPLNSREAVPQLACVAFELMRMGKQTATGRELISLLEEAREKVPQIRRYAKDTPDQFLKRVELRSGLLVEAGHQLDGVKTVPFYQFRHLTFQEHLAAVAAVEGHYLDYKQGDTVLTPLAAYLTAEEWKEVVPMAAVLARKQAEPLVSSLVAKASILREGLERGEEIPHEEWNSQRLPPTVARLVQCLTEEAEFAPSTLVSALQLIALFAKGCGSGENWDALARGPYGDELLHQIWMLYAPMLWREESWLSNTFAMLLAHRQPPDYLTTPEGRREILRLLGSDVSEEIVRGLLTAAGISLLHRINPSAPTVAELERHLIRKGDPAVLGAATWTWAMLKIYWSEILKTKPSLLNQFLLLWLGDNTYVIKETAAYGLVLEVGLQRSEWTPSLTDGQRLKIKEIANLKKEDKGYTAVNLTASLIVAFFTKDVWSDDELATRLSEVPESPPYSAAAGNILKQLGLQKPGT